MKRRTVCTPPYLVGSYHDDHQRLFAWMKERLTLWVTFGKPAERVVTVRFIKIK
jgi:hypothetical protein